MSTKDDGKVVWHITGADGLTWTSSTYRTYTGTIVFNGTDTYTLTIESGTVVTTHDTLKQAKREFRKYLLTR